MCFTCAITFQQTLVNMGMYCSFYEDRFTDNTIETNYKPKSSRAIMASIKEKIVSRNCCTENRVNAVAIQQDWEVMIGYGHTLQTFKVLLYTCTQKKNVRTITPTEKKIGLCKQI